MLKAALFSHDRVPSYALLLRLDDVAVKIGHTNRILCEHCNFSVAEKENIAGVLKNRRNIGRDKKFAIAESDDDRRPLANGDDRVGFVNGNDRKREDPF